MRGGRPRDGGRRRGRGAPRARHRQRLEEPARSRPATGFGRREAAPDRRIEVASRVARARRAAVEAAALAFSARGSPVGGAVEPPAGRRPSDGRGVRSNRRRTGVRDPVGRARNESQARGLCGHCAPNGRVARDRRGSRSRQVGKPARGAASMAERLADRRGRVGWNAKAAGLGGENGFEDERAVHAAASGNHGARRIGRRLRPARMPLLGGALRTARAPTPPARPARGGRDGARGRPAGRRRSPPLVAVDRRSGPDHRWDRCAGGRVSVTERTSAAGWARSLPAPSRATGPEPD